MLFNSLTFLLFLFINVLLFWLLNAKLRIRLLFLSSIVFYGFWRWDFVLLMLFSTILDYFMAIQINQSQSQFKKKVLLVTTLSINLGLLIAFKYLFFLTENINSLLDFFNQEYAVEPLKLILPLGISFYTFQTISYSIDVYRKHIIPEKNFALYGAYVTFFPQLVAGPILRAGEVIEQLRVREKFKIYFLYSGLKRILFGLFLKVVLADNIAPLVDDAFALDLTVLSAIDVITMAFLFGFQIFFDFAGYSHIAIGCAKLMGITFPENFDFPYIASSFKDFWKRWHISLSSWIRDYLYLPLLGVKVINKNSKSRGGLEVIKTQRMTIALFLTWAIMGLWHGASWTFVFWGIYHAFFIYMERKLSNILFFKSKLHSLIGWFIVLPIVMLSWIPFRAVNMGDTFILYGKMFNLDNYFHYTLRENYFLIASIFLLGFIVSYYISNWKPTNNRKIVFIYEYGKVLIYSIMLFLVFIFLRPITQFIYFQF